MDSQISRSSIFVQTCVLGVDGGGTTTRAMLADAKTGAILGRGNAGASNIQAVGVPLGLKALDESIDRAFLEAGLPRSTVAAACLGLAGIDWDGGLKIIEEWSQRSQLARSMEIANDATLLLAAGTPDGWGLAVIAGTGSIAFARTQQGEIGRCGGWGYILGDEGSAYQIALLGLRLACRSFDGIEPESVLVERFLEAMQLTEPPEMIEAVYRGAWDRTAIAGLAPLVLDAAVEGDALALRIVKQESRELAKTAVAAVRRNHLPDVELPIALAGGVLTKSEVYREEFLGGMLDAGISAGAVELVTEPALGAIVLARQLAAKE